MRVLVTGGAGFIGSHVVDRLLSKGCSVTVLDDLSTGQRDNLPAHHENLEFVEGDIRDVPTVHRMTEDVDAVVHLAAIASVQATVAEPVASHAVNFHGTLNLLEAMRKHGVRRMVYASSAAVYGDAAVPASEDDTPRPLTPYAVDKLAGELYLGFYARQHGITSVAFRFFNVYGPRQNPASPYSGVISIFADRLRRNEPLTIYGDGQQTRDYVYVGDVIEMIDRALVHELEGSHVLNLGTGTSISLLELRDTLFTLSGRRVESKHCPSRQGDILHSRADIARLRSTLGAEPCTTLLDGLRILVS